MKREKAKIEILSPSVSKTIEVARLLGSKLKKGDILALSGELGSGKTCFTTGLARGLGVSEAYQITSPTFTLINEYQSKYNLYHFDLYRLNKSSEFEDLGYEEYFSGKGVVVIEWAEKIAEILPPNAFLIKLYYVDENSRRINIQGHKKTLKKLAIDLGMEVG
jgi:tRNA threonylcarbamoyladenosine biosynthesis protein TsaE